MFILGSPILDAALGKSRRVNVPIIENSEEVIANCLSGQIWNAND